MMNTKLLQKKPIFLVICSWSVIVLLMNIALIFYSPLHTDEGVFLTISDQLLSGELPYKEIIDHKPPGIYYTLAPFLLIYNSYITAKAIVFLINILSAVLIIGIAYRLYDLRTGIIGSLIYLTTLPIYNGYYALTEPFVAFFILAAVATLLYVRKPYLGAFFSGISIGIAASFKHPAGLAVLAFLSYYFIKYKMEENNQVKESIHESMLCITGLSVPLALLVGIFTIYDAADEFLLWNIVVNFLYSGESSIMSVGWIYGHYRLIVPALIFWGLTIAGIVILGTDNRSVPTNYLLILLLLFSIAPIIIRPRTHYYLPAIPIASIIIATVVVGVLQNVEVNKKVLFTIFCSLLIISIVPLGATVGETVAAGSSYEEKEGKVVDYIQQESSDEELLIQLGGEPGFHYLTGLEGPDEHIYYFPANKNISYNTNSVIKTIDSNNVDYVVLEQGSWTCDTGVPEACDWVEENYTLAFEQEEYQVYVR